MFLALFMILLTSQATAISFWPFSKTPFQLELQKAEAGDSHAQNTVGCAYQAGIYSKTGETITKDLSKARAWYKKAAAQNNPYASYNLAWDHYSHQEDELDLEIAKDYVEKALKLINDVDHEFIADCKYLLALILSDLAENAQSVKEALLLFHQAATNGNIHAIQRLYRVYQAKEESYFRKEDWFKKCTETLDLENPEQASYWLHKWAEQGDPYGQLEQAKAYRNETKATHDSKKALFWFEKAALSGSAEAQFNLVWHYCLGISTQKNLETATNWYKTLVQNPSQEFINPRSIFKIQRGEPRLTFVLLQQAQLKNIKQNKDAQNPWNLSNAKDLSLTEIAKKAKQGNVDAQITLGKIYWHGIKKENKNTIHPNLSLALWWLGQALENGSSEAFEQIKKISDDYGYYELDSIEWLVSLLPKSNHSLKLVIGDLLYEKVAYKNRSHYNKSKNLEKKMNILSLAGELGSASALEMLGDIYNNSKEVSCNLAKVVTLYTQALSLQDPQKKELLEKLILLYESDTKDIHNQEAADQLYASAPSEIKGKLAYNLGCIYFSSEKHAHKKAIKWLQKALDQDEINFNAVIKKLILLHEDNAEFEQAKELYLKQSLENRKKLALEIGKAYLCAETPSKTSNEAQSMEWYQQAISAGVSPQETYYDRASTYEFRLENIREAFSLYKKAAELGHPESQYALACIYTENFNKPQYDNAFFWCSKAAIQNNVNAIFTLGTMYLSGRGTTKNLKQAIEYLQKASSLGDFEAQYYLSLMHRRGIGFPKNLKTADQLLLLAKKNIGNWNEEDVIARFEQLIDNSST